jgi:hypothetical protein
MKVYIFERDGRNWLVEFGLPVVAVAVLNDFWLKILLSWDFLNWISW